MRHSSFIAFGKRFPNSGQLSGPSLLLLEVCRYGGHVFL
jgi:hypothetical protein